MKKTTNIYSLSSELTTINKDMSSNIVLITIEELTSSLTNQDKNIVIFEWSSIAEINKIIDGIVNIRNTQLICIWNNLSPEGHYYLLANKIGLLSKNNFINIKQSDFIHWSHHDKYKILIVEDDIIQALSNETSLKKADIIVKTIQTDIEILESIKFYQPDLILIVLDLEEIAGDELVKLIRKNPENLSLPIVFLSLEQSEEAKQKVLNVGADEILNKPISEELLVSTLVERIQNNFFQQMHISQELPDSKTRYHFVIDNQHDRLFRFISDNKQNKSASIIWIKVTNKLALQKKIGLSGFKNACKEFLALLPMFNVSFSLKLTVTEGIFAFASEELPRGSVSQWVEEVQQWLENNYFSVRDKEFNLNIQTLILSDIPMKSNQEILIYEAERLLLNPKTHHSITFIAEGEDQKHFYLIKKELLHAIQLQNFKWLYQAIICTDNDSIEIFQLMLRVITRDGKELKSLEYIDIANQTGLLKLLDRFTLEQAIKMILDGEQQSIHRSVLLNQLISDYESKDYRDKTLADIRNKNLPKGRLIFQFRQDMTEEHTSLLSELGKELGQVNITVCLSEFDGSPMAWNIAQSLNVSWLRIKPIDSKSSLLNLKSPEYIGIVIKKAQRLGYKVMVPNIDSADLTANIWNLHANYIQGNFIQAPVSDIKYIEGEVVN